MDRQRFVDRQGPGVSVTTMVEKWWLEKWGQS
jgi:hypothetical protein